MLYYKTYQHAESTEWVTFVHGAGGSSSIWFKQIKSFKERYNVLLIDLRGHGKSQEMFQRYFTNEYNFENISKDIIEVLDHLKIQKSHFVGISLGTILIRTICEIAPERVNSLILGGAVTRLNVRSKFLVAVGNATKRFLPFMWLYKLFAWTSDVQVPTNAGEFGLISREVADRISDMPERIRFIRKGIKNHG